MALVPLSAMAAWEPELALWGPVVGAFSMFPLLERDGLALPYAALLMLHGALATGLLQHRVRRPSDPLYSPLLARVALQHRRLLVWGGVAAAGACHVVRVCLPPPPRLPWLWDRACVSLAYAFIADAQVYLLWRQRHQQRKSKLR